jgi:hypothetical protein
MRGLVRGHSACMYCIPALRITCWGGRQRCWLDAPLPSVVYLLGRLSACGAGSQFGPQAIAPLPFCRPQGCGSGRPATWGTTTAAGGRLPESAITSEQLAGHRRRSGSVGGHSKTKPNPNQLEASTEEEELRVARSACLLNTKYPPMDTRTAANNIIAATNR